MIKVQKKDTEPSWRISPYFKSRPQARCLRLFSATGIGSRSCMRPDRTERFSQLSQHWTGIGV